MAQVRRWMMDKAAAVAGAVAAVVEKSVSTVPPRHKPTVARPNPDKMTDPRVGGVLGAFSATMWTPKA